MSATDIIVIIAQDRILGADVRTAILKKEENMLLFVDKRLK